MVAVGDETDGKKVELLKARPQLNNQATAYLCRRFVCQQPVTSTDALTEQLANAHKEKKSTARKPAVWG